MTYFFKEMPSPIGILKLVASNKGLVAILWENDNPNRIPLTSLIEKKDHPILEATEAQLKAYFARKLDKFSLPLDFIGTEFQKKVWEALLTIPFGQTRSYQQIAQQIGHPKAMRAVGAANGKNPISIVVPCHRVIGANGKLTGFAGGLRTKEYLLDVEHNSDFIR
jgi:methylated-DNA-[protein]-cysteine S-methyltransferase